MKILIFTEGNWLSHISRPLVIANKLRQSGHQVIFCCSGIYANLILKDRFPVNPIYTKEPNLGLDKARRLGTSYDQSMVRKYLEADIQCIREHSPDLVVGDFRLTLGSSAEYCKVPYVSLLNGYWTNYYSASHTAPESLSIVNILGSKISNYFYPILKYYFLKLAALPFNNERRRLGLDSKRNLFDIMASDFANIIVDLPEFTPLKNLPSNYHVVGPIIWEPTMEPPLWLSKINPNIPTIYFTIGTTGYNQYFRTAIDLFGGKKYQVIMVTGEFNMPEEVPSNFFTARYAPGLQVMEISDIVICHGGNGTIYQALSKGTPIIGIPTMHDQWFNMERVEALGVGVKLSEKKFTSHALYNAVETLFLDQNYRKKASDLQSSIEKYNASQAAADIIAPAIKH